MGESYQELVKKGEDNRPAAEANTFSTFLTRVLHILARPSDFWEELREVATPVRHLMFPHLMVLVGVRAGAGFVGDLLQSVSLAPRSA